MDCRICQAEESHEILDLGFHPLADTFLSKEQIFEPEVSYPLKIQACPHCGLVQSSFVVSERLRYQENPYSYTSSSSVTAQRHFSSLAERVSNLFNLSESDLIVDIGSNTGTLLKAFKDLCHRTVGVEPSQNISQMANAEGIETINDFFNPNSAQAIVEKKGKATVVTATNVFNHIDDIYVFMESVDLLLSKNGVLVIEVPYLLDLIENLEYDTIYHEHLSYYSVKPLQVFFSRVGYKLFDVERIDYMGGSLRLFAGREAEHEASRHVNESIGFETSRKLHQKTTLERFARRTYKMKDELTWMLYKIKRKRKRIVGIGAPTKGNTLLNFCKIGKNVLDFLTERSPLKIGKYTPGTHIPILGDEMIYETKPDYALLLSWNLAGEIIGKFSEYSKGGGKFIIPIPEPRVTS